MKAELMRLRTELKRAVQVTMEGEVSASVAHELNQPLGAILNNAQAATRLLNSETPPLKEVRAALDDIVADDTRAAEIVRSVRELFRSGPRHRANIEVSAIFTEIDRLACSNARQAGASLKTEIVTPLPLIRGDKTQLIQGILNLVLNAFDAVSYNHDTPAEVVLHACGRT
jgi:two-component system, LuxR family, sensor kinase FixL